MRIVFSDLDGTFLNDKKQVTPCNASALAALAERGVPFVPCSGRPINGIYPEILENPATQYVVSANGAAIASVEHGPHGLVRTTLHTTPLAKTTALEVLELTRGRDVTFDIFADGFCYLERRMFDRLDEFSGGNPYIAQSLRSTRIAVDETPEETLARVKTLERVSVYWKDPRDRDEIVAALGEISGIDVTRSYPMNIEVMDEHANKGAALVWLCTHLGIDREDAVGFGDNLNDIPMLEAAGRGVAVANAEPEVREAADEVCGSFTESGVGAWLLAALGVVGA